MTVASSVATALLVTVGAGDVALGIVLFALAHVAHLLALSLYNSYLPLIAAPNRFARVSGLAWGLSYLGSIACYFLTPALHSRWARTRQCRDISPAPSPSPPCSSR